LGLWHLAYSLVVFGSVRLFWRSSPRIYGRTQVSGCRFLAPWRHARSSARPRVSHTQAAAYAVLASRPRYLRDRARRPGRAPWKGFLHEAVVSVNRPRFRTSLNRGNL